MFTVQNLEIAKTFYTENLGFNVAFSGEWYIHLVSESGVQIGFLLPNHPSQPEIFQKQYSGEGVIFSLEVEDADAAFVTAKSKAMNIVLDIRSEDWGQRHFCIEDPNGIFIDIVQSFEPTGEYQDGYVSD